MIFQCDPINKFWNEELPGTCFSKASVEKIIIIQGGGASTQDPKQNIGGKPKLTCKHSLLYSHRSSVRLLPYHPAPQRQNPPSDQDKYVSADGLRLHVGIPIYPPPPFFSIRLKSKY